MYDMWSMFVRVVSINENSYCMYACGLVLVHARSLVLVIGDWMWVYGRCLCGVWQVTGCACSVTRAARGRALTARTSSTTRRYSTRSSGARSRPKRRRKRRVRRPAVTAAATSTAATRRIASKGVWRQRYLLTAVGWSLHSYTIRRPRKVPSNSLTVRTAAICYVNFYWVLRNSYVNMTVFWCIIVKCVLCATSSGQKVHFMLLPAVMCTSFGS